MASRLMDNFNALKAKGMTDSEAMKKASELTATGTAKLRAGDAKLRRKRSGSKIKMAITGKASLKSHSPAGRAYLKRKKAGV